MNVLPRHTYRVGEFAELAGITVKALHHYERLGLLAPARSDAGYRLYAAADLERLEQIVALRFLGIPLRRIAGLLRPHSASPGPAGSPARVPPLLSTLRHQRDILHDQRRAIDRAVDALDDAVRAVEGGAPLQPVLQRVIGAMTAHGIDGMSRYYSDEAWAAARQYYQDWPSAEWQALFRDIERARSLPAGSAHAQALADRWRALFEASAPPGAARTGFIRAWRDREHWPAVLKRRLSGLDVDEAMAFLGAAFWERWEAERESQPQPVGAAPRASEARCTVLQAIERAMMQEARKDNVAPLIARWRALLDEEIGEDPEARAEVEKRRATRHDWPPAMTRYIASLYDMDADRWTRVMDFIDAST